MSSNYTGTFSQGKFNMDNGDGSVKVLPRYTYEGNGHSFDVIHDATGALMCSLDSGPWREFRNNMPFATYFAAVILNYNLEG